MAILVATGGSAHSDVALTCAAGLARVMDVDLTILSVVKRPAGMAGADAILERARHIVDPVFPSARVQTRVRVGHPAEEIVAEAEAHPYDIVVVGEKQHHGLLARFVIGSTAQRVIEHAPCPIVLAKGGCPPIGRILVCDSGRVEDSIVRRLVDRLGSLARGAEEVVVLHVMSQMVADPRATAHEIEADAAALIAERLPEGRPLAEGVAALRAEEVRAVPLVRHGLVVDEILAEAKEGDYALVVVGAHEGAGWRRVLLDDITHEMIVGLDRPVLIVGAGSVHPPRPSMAR